MKGDSPLKRRLECLLRIRSVFLYMVLPTQLRETNLYLGASVLVPIANSGNLMRKRNNKYTFPNTTEGDRMVEALTFSTQLGSIVVMRIPHTQFSLHTTEQLSLLRGVYGQNAADPGRTHTRVGVWGCVCFRTVRRMRTHTRTHGTDGDRLQFRTTVAGRVSKHWHADRTCVLCAGHERFELGADSRHRSACMRINASARMHTNTAQAHANTEARAKARAQTKALQYAQPQA